MIWKNLTRWWLPSLWLASSASSSSRSGWPWCSWWSSPTETSSTRGSPAVSSSWRIWRSLTNCCRALLRIPSVEDDWEHDIQLLWPEERTHTEPDAEKNSYRIHIFFRIFKQEFRLGIWHWFFSFFSLSCLDVQCPCFLSNDFNRSLDWTSPHRAWLLLQMNDL